MQKSNYKVVKSVALSSPYDPRYIVVDAESGKTRMMPTGMATSQRKKPMPPLGTSGNPMRRKRRRKRQRPLSANGSKTTRTLKRM